MAKIQIINKGSYKYWRMACANLNIEGTSLYPGTKHTSIMDLRHKFTPEQIRKSVQIKGKSFDHYLQANDADEREMFEVAKGKVIQINSRKDNIGDS